MGKSRPNTATSIFLIATIFVLIFKIEFFPFSNYQMYSEVFDAKKNYEIFKIYTVDNNGQERLLINSKFKIYQYEMPLVEAIYRNVKNGRPLVEIAKDLLKILAKQDPTIVKIKIYNLVFSWEDYKKKLLDLSYKPTFRLVLLEEVPN